jgi:hypothetical protein
LAIAAAAALEAPLALGLFPKVRFARGRARDRAWDRERASSAGLGLDRRADQVMSLPGLAFLLLLAGLEVEYELRGRLLRRNASGTRFRSGGKVSLHSQLISCTVATGAQ